MSRPKVRPLFIRPGARYVCFGDGLCCSDIHGLGALTRKEVASVRRLDVAGARWDETFDDYMLETKPDGTCVFLLPDRRCSVHARFGHAHKPGGCRRFPLGLVATPAGGRVTTEHRCPCRTMGDRPPLTSEGVEPSLHDDAGRLTADRRVERVRLDPRRSVSFEKYLGFESELLARLAGGEAPEQVLDARPFPRLSGAGWRTEAEGFLESRDGTQFGLALAWFADAILALKARRRPPRRARPWAASFDRAEARSPSSRTETEVLADWLADEIWSLRWTEEGHFARARAELATRLAIARHVAGRLRRSGLRADRATAEAVMIIDLLGGSDYWDDVVKRIRA